MSIGVADLLLGSDIGLWVASVVDPLTVGTVQTEDPEIAAVATRRGLAIGPPSSPRALSVHYPRILLPRELRQWNAAYNLHPAFLPWGRGHFPLVWAIADAEPAGATLHRMTPRVDGGPIVEQIRVAIRANDTGHSLFLRIREAERRLFLLWWPRIASGAMIIEHPQPRRQGSYHDKAAFAALLQMDPDTLDPKVEDRIRRALTFPGKPALRARSLRG